MRFDQVSLETLQRNNRHIEGHCIECDAVLHVDLGSVVAAHGKSATLASVGYTILCPVCEAAGLFLRETPDLYEMPIKSNVAHPTLVVHD